MLDKTFAVKRAKYTGGEFSKELVLVEKNTDGTENIITLMIGKS